MMLLIVSTFWHLQLGLQVVIEDYVHDEGDASFAIVLLNFFAIAGARARDLLDPQDRLRRRRR